MVFLIKPNKHKGYSHKQMQEMLKGLPPNENVTYIIDNDLYLYNPNKGYFEKLNTKKLTSIQVKNIFEDGNANNKAVTICYTGDDIEALMDYLLNDL